MHHIITFIAQDLIALSFVAIPFTYLKLERSRRRSCLVFLLLSLLAVLSLTRLAASAHLDVRPFVHDGVTAYFKSATDNGFPSDHTVIASFCAYIVLRYSLKYGLSLLVLAGLIGTARVIGNVHHGQDVVGGFAVSLVAVGIGYVLSRTLASVSSRRLKLSGFITAAVVLLVVLVGVNMIPKKQLTVAAQAPLGTYVALGDSVAAGVGLGDYIDASACDRTAHSYPAQLAQKQHLALTSIACSSATIPAGVSGSQTVNQLALQPQLDTLFAQAKQPQLITLTIGANDADWTSVLQKCYVSECGDAADEASVKSHLATMATNLQTALVQITQHYPKTRVIVTGYYQVFPQTQPQTCSDLTGIDSNELAYGRQLQTDISATIKTVVDQQTAVRYVPLSFAGHELCTTNSWIQGLGASQPYHPTLAGQSAIATQIITALK